MTNTGMFEDAKKIEYLEKQIDTLETDINPNYFNSFILKQEIKELKEALEQTE